MEYFRLEQAAGRVILCDHSGCEEAAEYLELDGMDYEHLVCATHTSSDKQASALLRRAASPRPTPIARSARPPKVKGPIRCHKCQQKCPDAEHYLNHACISEAVKNVAMSR
jgi:hypothetical protein